MDNANITVYVPNWTTIPQQSSATFGGGVGYLSTGDTFFEVFEGPFLLDATTNTWRPCRGYATQEGLQLIMGFTSQPNDQQPRQQDLPGDVSKVPV
jgi:hypothetical protein